jgi:predicted dehydrogenase
MTDSDIMQIGIIGIGGHGMGNVYPHIQNNPRMRIRAVCDIIETQLEIGKAEYDPDYGTTDYTDLLADDGIDAIISSTSDEFHAPIALDCLRGGKDVFIEKPMGTTLEQCQALIRAEKECGKFVMVGVNRRFAPCMIDIRQALKEAAIAPELQQIGRNAPVIHWSMVDDPRNSSMTIDPLLVGRLNRETCHIFDVTTWLLESEPVSIYAVGGNRIDKDTENRAVVTITYENGGVASIIMGSISHISMPKERMDLWADGLAIRMESFLDVRIADDDSLAERSYCGFKDGRPGEVKTQAHEEHRYFRSMQETLKYYVEKGVYSAPNTKARIRAWEDLGRARRAQTLR